MADILDAGLTLMPHVGNGSVFFLFMAFAAALGIAVVENVRYNNILADLISVEYKVCGSYQFMGHISFLFCLHVLVSTFLTIYLSM